MEIEGNLVDVEKGIVYPAKVTFGKTIEKIEKVEKKYDSYIIPGLIDSHIHIESTMLCPSRFSEIAIAHGTTAVIADPHEIANVMGLNGVRYMNNDAITPMKIFFAAPSCVPATVFETSGAVIGPEEIDEMMKWSSVVALGEMMNFPGVINNDPDVMSKIDVAKQYSKPIDGHAPLLRGPILHKYIAAGISTDHECTTIEEAEEKARNGMKIMIREGSSSKNMKELLHLADDYECFFCTDDLHADDLLKGHINLLLKKAVELGLEPVKAVQCATIYPAKHYGLNFGVIAEGKEADIVVVDNLDNFNIQKVFVNGELVVDKVTIKFEVSPKEIESTFKVSEKKAEDFIIYSEKDKEKVRVIKVVPDQLITKSETAILKVTDGDVQPDPFNDVMKIFVVERYGKGNIGKGFISGFRLRRGAIASSVAHDSHNIIVVGTNNKDIASAVNEVIRMKGGIAAVCNNDKALLELPIAGLMTTDTANTVKMKLDDLNKFAKGIGCNLKAPFMTLSFMALLVMPDLKLSDKGLFDGKEFKLTELFVK